MAIRPVRALVAAAALTRGTLFGVVLTTTLAGAALSGGCVLNYSVEEETRTSNIPHMAASPIVVDTANGAITVTTAAEAKDVTIVAKLRAQTKERLAATKVLAERKDDKTLSVYVKWPDDKRLSYEGCAFEIVLPDAADARLTSSNGAVTAKGINGPVLAESSNGAITIEHAGGPATAKTSNGAVTINHATGKVIADSSNGAIRVSLAKDAKGPVKLDTSNGSITLSFGPAFVGVIDADTSNGRVTINGIEAARVKQPKKSEATVTLGEGEKSTLDTSNGSITIERRAE
ncbi:MAG: DUF4097 family beta strand repeat protein [Phycisphaerales bacterium]|jgi:DUF4097 and DUF4098 domain-containing protein YvlB|nr:DUF4097 family beta strand repeat protein [Phycisphaerales bacterium]